jgi:hypothetical protein
MQNHVRTRMHLISSHAVCQAIEDEGSHRWNNPRLSVPTALRSMLSYGADSLAPRHQDRTTLRISKDNEEMIPGDALP